MQIFEGNEYILKQQYQMSATAVVIIGLLRRKNVYITEPLLELGRPNEPLVGLFKDRSLVDAIESIDKLKALQLQYDVKDHFALLVLDHGNHRVLALQEEVLAEAGWSRQVQGSSLDNTALQKISMESAISSELRLQGLEHLFSGEEITKIKLSIATAVKPEEKIEAIRKMNLSQESEHEKALLFLHALADIQWAVRKEALQSLYNVGVKTSLVEVLLWLEQNNETIQRQALHSLGVMFQSATEFEKAVILQILLSILREPMYRAVSVDMLQTLSCIIPHIPGTSVSMMERILLCTTEILLSKLDQVGEIAGEIFSQIASIHNSLFTKIMWEQVQKLSDRRVLAYLLIQLVTKSSEILPLELSAKIVYEFSLGDEIDNLYMRLAGAIVHRGENIIPELLQRFRQTLRSTEHISIIKVLDRIFAKHKLTKDIKQQVVYMYTEILGRCPEAVRMVLLENHFITDAEIEETLKVEFCHSVLMEIQLEKLGQYPQAVKACLCRMSTSAVQAISQILERPLKPAQLEYIAEILGDVSLSFPKENSQELIFVKEFCQKKIADKVSYAKILFGVLGKVAMALGTSPDTAEDIAEYLLGSLYTSPSVYAVLHGLGWTIAGSNISSETKTDVCYLFMSLLDKRLPDTISEIKKVGNSQVFIFSNKSTAYTELLPILMTGLQRLALSFSTPQSLRQRISDYLLKKWQNLVEYKVFWGPKNTVDLAGILASILCHPSMEDKERSRLGHALLQKSDILTVMEFLIDSLSRIQLADVCDVTAHKLLDLGNSNDYRNPEDRENIMSLTGKFLCEPNIQISRMLQEQLLYLLLDGLREQVFGIENTLQKVQGLSHIPKDLQDLVRRKIPISFS